MVKTVGPASIRAPCAADRDLPHLAAGRRCALQHRDVEAARGEVERGGQASDAGADHGDAVAATLSHASAL